VFLAQHVDAKRKASTAEQYRDALERLVLPELGMRKTGKVTVAEIAKLHATLGEHPYQANRVLAVVGSLYSFAAKRHLVPHGMNPARGIEKYPEEGRERFLSTDELTRLGDALREAETIGLPYAVDRAKPKAKHAAKEENRRTVIGPHAAAAMRLLILTGARLREILHLRWEHVDFERGMLLLPDSKTGKKAIVLNAPALDVLANLPRVGAYVIAGQAAGAEGEGPRHDLKRPWQAVAKQAGLDGVRTTTCAIPTRALARARGSDCRLSASCSGTHRQAPRPDMRTLTRTRCAARPTASAATSLRPWATPSRPGRAGQASCLCGKGSRADRGDGCGQLAGSLEAPPSWVPPPGDWRKAPTHTQRKRPRPCAFTKGLADLGWIDGRTGEPTKARQVTTSPPAPGALPDCPGF
jgi:integrase